MPINPATYIYNKRYIQPLKLCIYIILFCKHKECIQTFFSRDLQLFQLSTIILKQDINVIIKLKKISFTTKAY